MIYSIFTSFPYLQRSHITSSCWFDIELVLNAELQKEQLKYIGSVNNSNVLKQNLIFLPQLQATIPAATSLLQLGHIKAGVFPSAPKCCLHILSFSSSLFLSGKFLGIKI